MTIFGRYKLIFVWVLQCMNDVNRTIRLTVVIPCYNESDRIGLMYGGVEDFINKWQGDLEFIIINDGSKDDTGRLLQSHDVYKRHSNIISIYNQENTGKGGALKNGVLRAKGNFILTLDADMAAPPVELIQWLDSFGGHFPDDAILIGSREHKDSIIHEQVKRKFVGNIFNSIVRVLTPLKLMDTQCGFKLYPAMLAKDYFGDLQTNGWAHDVEILYKAYLHKKRIIEMPLSWSAVDGSKIQIMRDGFKMLFETLSIVTQTKKQFLRKTKAA